MFMCQFFTQEQISLQVDCVNVKQNFSILIPQVYSVKFHRLLSAETYTCLVWGLGIHANTYSETGFDRQPIPLE